VHNLQLDKAIFLRDYWQQQPMVIRQGFPGFDDFLDEHDLAGLSELEEVDSRIIQFHQQQWRIEHGPFEDFEAICQGAWTLLVQGVDRYIDEAAELMEAFNFVPYWRMDDLMISYATPDAGVGPHLDQYDVFLVQGQGRRHWKVGRPGNHETHFPHPQLAQVAPFPPVIDVILEPGDILYIPPGWPHDGVALDNCLTYSVGFRAPDQRQLVNALPDIFDEQNIHNVRYSDATRQPARHPGRVTQSELSTLKSMILDALNQPQWEQSVMRLLSDQQLPIQVPATLIQPQAVVEAVNTGERVCRMPGCRPLFLDNKDTAGLHFFINAEGFTYAGDNTAPLLSLLAGEPVNNIFVETYKPDGAFFDLLATLINKGYWELTDNS